MDDYALLREFVRSRSEGAFRELVDRHVGMVYSAACRMVRDTRLAEEVVQCVFLTLARKAAAIGPHQIIAGWLHNTTRLLAMHAVRSEQRRRKREETAVAMQLHKDESPPDWILEHLEFAMGKLNANDRDAIVLRYLEGRSLREVGAELGVSEDAARMRVNQALERLRKVLEKDGGSITSIVLGTALTTNTVTVVPAGLAGSTTAAVMAAATTGMGLSFAGASVAKWFSLKTAGTVVGLAVVAGVSAYMLHQQRADRSQLSETRAPAGPQQAQPLPQAEIAAQGASARSIVATNATPPGAGIVGNQTRGPAPAASQQPPVSDDAQTPVERAIELLSRNQFDEARQLLDKAIAIKPDFAVAFLYRGNAFDGLRERDKAMADYTRAGELQPSMPQAWFQRSRIYEQIVMYYEAIHDCDRAITLDPKFWQAHVGRGRALYSLGLTAESRAALERALEIKPDCKEAKEFVAKLDAGPADRLTALENARKAVAANPQDARAHVRLGNLLWQLGLYEECLPHFTRAIDLEPTYAASWRERGSAKSHLGRHQEAIADYTEYLRIEPQDYIYTANRGMVYFEIGELDKALADLDRAIRLEPGRSDYYTKRGRIRLNLGKPEEALPDFDKSLALTPERNYNAWFFRARAYLMLGQTRKAIEDDSRIIAVAEGWDHALEDRAGARFSLGEFDLALRDYSRALELHPDFADAAVSAGRCSLQLGRADQALDFFTRAENLKPAGPDRYEHRANVYANWGRWIEAIADYSEAIQRRPDVGRLRLYRCFCLACIGKTDEALADALAGLACKKLDPQEQWYLLMLASGWQRERGRPDESKRLISQARPSPTNGWPAAIVFMLRGDLAWEQLLKQAKSVAEQSEARFYGGWLDLSEGRVPEGQAKLRWVTESGDTNLFEYHLARRLLSPPPSKPAATGIPRQ